MTLPLLAFTINWMALLVNIPFFLLWGLGVFVALVVYVTIFWWAPQSDDFNLENPTRFSIIMHIVVLLIGWLIWAFWYSSEHHVGHIIEQLPLQ